MHFAAWRYGCGAVNPYEQFVLGLARGEPVEAVRQCFIDFLRQYRPRDLGAALGVRLEREYPLWYFPWSRRLPPPAWHERPADCPDILTHFSPAGIPRHRLEEEFSWLEETFRSIRRDGYDRSRGGPLLGRRLLAGDGRERYVIEDGNHRLSALSAAGVTHAVVRYLDIATVEESKLPRWKAVATGAYLPQDASRVFHAYFDGNSGNAPVVQPATILESPGAAAP